MFTFKEKSMMKVSIKTSTGSIEYKGIVAFSNEEKFILIPFDSTSKNAEGLHLLYSDVVESSTARFPQEVSTLLKDTYESHRKMKLAEEQIKKLEKELSEARKEYTDLQTEVKGKTEVLNSKRFEFIGTPQDIASKLMRDIHHKGSRIMFNPNSHSNKVIRVSSIQAVENEIVLDIDFENEVHGEHCEGLYWLDYERYYDSVDWDAFKKKYCPSVLSDLKEALSFAKIISETRDCGRGEEKRRIPLETRYKISLKIKKENYEEILKKLHSGLIRMKQVYCNR